MTGYRIDRPTGMLSLIGHTSQGVSGPTNFVIDPSGRWLYVDNSTADSVAQFAVGPERACGRRGPLRRRTVGRSEAWERAGSTPVPMTPRCRPASRVPARDPAGSAGRAVGRACPARTCASRRPPARTGFSRGPRSAPGGRGRSNRHPGRRSGVLPPGKDPFAAWGCPP
ncbi:beta-propeller fold lactonase family protein [Streptomyces mirabilis]|uniref:beta-propeller fold lactonase family protein n=1 Tax=Streptomyces mirabilis TaxID=68239 RepID=UPI0033F97997